MVRPQPGGKSVSLPLSDCGRLAGPASRRALRSPAGRVEAFVECCGPPEQITLCLADFQFPQYRKFGLGFHAFCDHLAADFLGEADQRGGQRAAGFVQVDLLDQAGVELDDVRVEFENVSETGEARTCIVDSQLKPAAAQSGQMTCYICIVRDRGDSRGRRLR